MTYQLCKCSEELRELSALNLLPTSDQDPFGASPTLEVQVAGRVMADMFDDRQRPPPSNMSAIARRTIGASMVGLAQNGS